MHSLYSPKIFFKSNPFRTSYPFTYGIHDRLNNTGYGTNEGGQATLQSAYGEFLERYIFRFHVPQLPNKLPLLKIPGTSFGSAFNQIISTKLKDTLSTHSFELVHALNIIKGEEEVIPRTLVTLGNSNDREYFLAGDSTGCAGHVDIEKCFEASLLEFVERQYAISSWLGLNSIEQINMSSERDFLEPLLKRVIDFFNKRGNLLVYNLSKNLNSYTVIAIFTSDNFPVKFTAGLGSAFTPLKAFKKAFMELFQLYDWVADIEYFKPASEEKVRKLNHQSTLSKLSWINNNHLVTRSHSITDFLNSSKTNKENVLKELSKFSDQIYYFTTSLKIGTQLFIVGKVLSADFFLSSSGAGNNWLNKFSMQQGLNIDTLPQEACPLF